jgi:hypothetical protein
MAALVGGITDNAGAFIELLAGENTRSGQKEHLISNH